MKAMIMVLLAVLPLVACSQKPDVPDSFAQCLTDHGVVMYGTQWCSHCNNQKAAFGDAFRYVTFVDCDQDRSACDAAGVEGYPTWIVNGESHPGEQNLLFSI